MREQSVIAQRYLRELARYKKLKASGRRDADADFELVTCRSALYALGWALGVDPSLGQSGGYRAAEMASLEGKEPLRGVRLTGAWRDVWQVGGLRYWLLEVPASREAGTEYWACFLAERSVAELAVACGAAFFGSTPTQMRALIEQSELVDQPTVRALGELIARGAAGGSAGGASGGSSGGWKQWLRLPGRRIGGRTESHAESHAEVTDGGKGGAA